MNLSKNQNPTDREEEILVAIASGKSNREISENFYISEGTVDTHINNLYRKIGVKNRVQATHYAIRKGLYLP